jgi:hypothetical protein
LDVLPPGSPTRLGDYELLGLLGSGGTSEVFYARRHDEEPVALKVVHRHLAADATVRERLGREMAMAAVVQSITTVEVLDADAEAERPWIATRYVEGPTLDEYIVSSGPLPEAELRSLGIALLEAIDGLHRVNILHRDIKPSNVILSPDGPRLIDLGIALDLENTRLTETGGAVGTPAYMAPETIVTSDVGPEVDVFGWGATMAFAGTGRDPFGRGNAAAVIHRVLRDDPDLDGVPPSLTELLATTLAKDAADRPTLPAVLRTLDPLATMDALGTLAMDQRVMLEAAPEGTSSPRVHLQRSAPADDEPARRRALPLVAAGFVMVLLGAIGAFALVSNAGSDTGETVAGITQQDPIDTVTGVTAGAPGPGATDPVTGDTDTPTTTEPGAIGPPSTEDTGAVQVNATTGGEPVVDPNAEPNPDTSVEPTDTISPTTDSTPNTTEATLTTEAPPTTEAAPTTEAVVDDDGDGASPPADCNDRDDTVYPGAVEIADDGIDQDCNGADEVTELEITGLSAVALGADRARVTFSTNRCATVEAEYSSTSSGGGTVAGGSACDDTHDLELGADEALAPGTRYSVEVTAGASGVAEVSETVTVTTDAAEMMNLRARAKTPNAIEITFSTNVCGAATYSVTSNDGQPARSPHSGIGCALEHRLSWGDEKGTNLRPGSTYTFTVDFVSPDGVELSDSVSATTPALAFTTSPVYSRISPTQVVVTFDTNGCAAGDYTYRSTDGTDTGAHVGSDQLPRCWTEHQGRLGSGQTEPLLECRDYIVDIVVTDEFGERITDTLNLKTPC